jgi:rRNA maturation RNase YbeY
LSGTLLIRNRQCAVPVNVRYLRRLIGFFLRDLAPKHPFDLGIYLVRPPEMARLNETFLRHKGSTDVITFDYGFGVPASAGRKSFHASHQAGSRSRLKAELRTVHGEIFVCLDEAVSQARRFRTTWQSELARYVIHAVLHLNGYDDRHAAARRKMKREENRLLRQLSTVCPVSKLARHDPPGRRASIVLRKS